MVPLLPRAIEALELGLSQAQAAHQVLNNVQELVLKPLPVDHVHHYDTDLIWGKLDLLLTLQGPLQPGPRIILFLGGNRLFRGLPLFLFQAIHPIQGLKALVGDDGCS